MQETLPQSLITTMNRTKLLIPKASSSLSSTWLIARSSSVQAISLPSAKPYPLISVVSLPSTSSRLAFGALDTMAMQLLALQLATAGKLCMNPLGYAVELVRKVKNELTEEYMKSVADLLVIKGRPNLTAVRSLAVSDVRKARMDEVDFGWGNAIFGGPAIGGAATVLGLTSFYMRFKNNKQGIVVPLSLPAPAMERFVLELEDLFKRIPTNEAKNSKHKFVSSTL
ncbi:Benzyl alcohol O-benzoyltransferase, partial [Cucurbita argyrosperma subsp. sororia]